MLPPTWQVIRDGLDEEELHIILAALAEFETADRWDEFDYATFRNVWRMWSGMCR